MAVPARSKQGGATAIESSRHGRPVREGAAGGAKNRMAARFFTEVNGGRALASGKAG